MQHARMVLKRMKPQLTLMSHSTLQLRLGTRWYSVMPSDAMMRRSQELQSTQAALEQLHPSSRCII